MKVLVLDIGGNNVKMLVTGAEKVRKFPSGSELIPEDMVEEVKQLTKDWEYDAVSIGYPGVVKHNRVVVEPHNLGPGWTDFDFEEAFGCPVKLINDAAMQALGSYKAGVMLFLGLGTGLGAAMVIDGVVLPTEIAHMPYRKGTFEDYLGERGLKKLGQKKWEKHLHACVEILRHGFHPDDIVLGGGNSKIVSSLPEGCRLGSNKFAFEGGFRLWNQQGL
ncbi:ROK family protein [Flavihumibacter rivuli]|uniref:ROK family protein n=1 Tax=Flavihumibacter rivuli TaxID=2838156 RepID=UPI001BDEBF6A|nr:ROK family protein [Flavihumibacter rivuli]ULQ55952.1 ROK family protein [Flavihumibacter rivuli]